MADRSRAKETTLVFSEQGYGTLAGSFATTTDWKLEPDAEITDTQFTGAAEADYDLNHKGWKFSCNAHEVGPDIRRMYLRQVAANNGGLPRPKITITATTRYRDGSTPPFTQKLGSVVLKLDGVDVSGGDFIKVAISGSCSFGDERAGTR